MKDGEQVDPTAQALDALRVGKILGQDVLETRKALEAEPESQLLRRNYVRALFAWFEGQLFLQRFVVLFWHNLLTLGIGQPGRPRLQQTMMLLDFPLPPEVLLALSEQNPSISDDGEVAVRDAFLFGPKSVRLAFSVLRRFFRLKTPINYGGDWRCLKESFQVRNRLTHPKSAAALLVSDREIDEMDKAYDWFNDTLLSITREVDVLNRVIGAALKEDQG